MWLYVWRQLNDTENDFLILKDINMSKTTIIKYLDFLSMKGIIRYAETVYVKDRDGS